MTAHTSRPPTPVLVADSVTKTYGPVLAPAGASVAVAAGESLAVMGPSGSDKTSLLHCLAGIVAPDGGRVLLDGCRYRT